MTVNQRILSYFMAIMLAFSVIILIILQSYESKFKEDRMCYYLALCCDIAHAYPELAAAFPDSCIRITVFDTLCNVRFDSKYPVAADYNHSKEPEFSDIDEVGESHSFRKSRLDGKYYFFYVKKYDDGYLRVAKSYNARSEFFRINIYSLLEVLMFFLMSSFVFYWVSRRFGKTLKKLKHFIENVDSDEEQFDFPDNEFKQISEQISRMYHNMSLSQKGFATEREKLLSHLKISKRGLAIFSPQRKEILSNDLFIQYINMMSDKRLQYSEEVFDMPEFGDVVEYLDDRQSLIKDFVGTKIFYINKNDYTLLITCIVFNDKSFEINIEDVTKQQEQDMLKRQLTQNISHELKTPVSSIQGFMEILMNNPDIDEEKRNFYIQRSYSQALRLTYLLRDISMLTKLDESSDLFERAPVKLKTVIENVLQDVALELEDKNFKVRVKVSDKVEINGNDSLLYSLFRNLVDNSLHYAGTDITITINCYRSDDEFYYFSFADNGVGVEDKHLVRIFERFYRVDKGRSRKLGGTGLGLAIVKNAIAVHGGRISAKKHAGGGLEFLFTLRK